MFSIDKFEIIIVSILGIGLYFFLDAIDQRRNTLQAIDDVLLEMYTEGVITKDIAGITIIDRLRFRRPAKNIEHASIVCGICKWTGDSVTYRIPKIWEPVISKKHSTIIKISPELSDLKTDIQIYFSPLIETEISRYYVIQCNLRIYDKIDYRLILLERRGKRYRFVIDIFRSQEYLDMDEND